MAKSLRNYPSGVRTALIALSGGTCYYPDCREPVVRFVSGKPIPHLEVAHIVASSDDGPRGDHRVDPDDRDLFENLILLCAEHHKVVDNRKLWHRYPKEMLREWKNDREEGARDSLAGLREISPAKLRDLVSEAVAARDENLEDMARRLSGVDAEGAASIRAVLEELKRFQGDEFIEASYRMQEAAYVLQDHAVVMQEFGSGALTMQDLVGIMAQFSQAMQKLEEHQDLLGNLSGGMGW